MDQSNTQQSTINPDVKSYLETILQDAGMLSLDEQMKDEMIKELYARLDTYIASSLIENLPEDKVEPFIKMNEEGKPQAEIEQYLKESLPNYQEVLSNTFVTFRDLYLGNVAVARNAPQPNQQNGNEVPTE